MELYVVTLRKVCISMNINTISYWIAEAVASILKNAKIFLSGVAVTIVTLLCISLLYFAYIAGDGILEMIEDSQGIIEIFLEDISDEQAISIKNMILEMDGVENVEYINKEQAVQRAEEKLQGRTKGLPADFFPAMLRVSVNDLERANEIGYNVRAIEGVGEKKEDVSVNSDAELIGKIAVTIKVIAITVFILAVVAASFIMMNSIKLMLYARRKEISIMKYVGATDLFTKAPFVIEGLIIALISALVVILISNGFAGTITDLATNHGMFGFLAVSNSEMSTLVILLICLASGIGIFGSSMSINKYLDV